MAADDYTVDKTPASEYHSLRVYLFCPDDTFRSVWVSFRMDGRYNFADDHGNIDLPFFIEKQDGIWRFFANKADSLYAIDINTGKRTEKRGSIDLSHQLCIYIQYNGGLYRLYVEFEREGDLTFLPYYLEPLYDDYTIGRHEDNLMRYKNSVVSRKHACLHWNGHHWEVIDNKSTNGVYVNGRRVTKKELALGDIVFIMGLYIIMGTGYVLMNNATGRVTLNTPHIRLICDVDEKNIKFSPAPRQKTDVKLFDRPPRKLLKIDPQPIEIEMPPMKMGGGKMPLLLRLGTPMLMGGNALLTGNYLMAMTSLVMPALNQGFTEKDRKEYEEKRKVKYAEYLEQIKKTIEKERKDEITELNAIHPAINQVCTFAFNKNRLWERRKIDEDFLTIRVGTGKLPMIAERQYNRKRFELEPDELETAMYEIAEKPVYIDPVPITLSLKEDFVIGAQGDDRQIADMVRNLVLQLAMTHSYDELKICVLANEEYADKLNFIRYIPHNWDNDKNVRFFATTQDETQAIAEYFKNIDEEVFNTQNESDIKARLNKEPAYVVIALDKKLFESLEVMKHATETLEYRGITILAAFDGVPKECSKIIDLNGGTFTIVDLKHPEKTEVKFALDSYDPGTVKNSLQIVDQTKLKIGSEMFTLPNTVTFLEMYNVGKVEHLNPMNRWAENNPVKTLSVPVGVGTDGKLFTLDLHQKKQGPHGLIAGMTGSGKSEFIITYILSMAVNFSPEEVAFILIDYKGGGLTDAFEDKSRGIHLPHVVGTITNLDGSAIQRSLMSINSELKRRQSVFKKAKSATNEGTMDIYDYQKLYRMGKVKEPMPHLFIISDEFAELKKQQPEFMDELISTARIGRSLGVHLILATQKPGGVVNDQIWSNTRFRVSLKVQDRSDSMEMLKRPEAAELKQTGRFYLQVGYNEYFALGQSAWCGAGYVPTDEVVTQEDNSVNFIDSAGRVILNAKPKKAQKKAESKQIVAIVQYLSDLAVRENIKIRSLWMEPLAAKIEFLDLPKPEAENITASIGVVDDPEFQTQYPFTLDMQSFHHMLICGPSGSGKSTMLRTMLYSLVDQYSPEDVNYYILDLSAGALTGFSNMPHCGGYVNEEGESDFERMLKLIKDIVAERKKLFADAEVFSYDAYRKIKKLPLIMVIIDGWQNITSFRKGQEFQLTLHENMREAANYGVRFILTINHNNEVSAKARQELDYRIALSPKDKFEYNDLLNVRGSVLPPQMPGRGVCVIEGRPLEFHVAVPNCQKDDQKQNELLKKKLADLTERYSGCKEAVRLPMLDNIEEYTDFAAGFKKDRIPLGYAMANMQKTAMPLQQLYTTSLFFGNPVGIRPVVGAFMYAFYREHGNVIVMRRNADTIFDRKSEENLKRMFGDRFTLLETNAEGIKALDDMIIEDISVNKKQYRDEYCEQKGIPSTDQGRTKKAARYIREHSKPLFVFFESFADLLRMSLDEMTQAEFAAFFEKIKGYNVYFFGGFYPEDENLSSKVLFRSFAKEDFAMLFGGRYNTVWCTSISGEFKRMEKVNPNYNRFVMKYHSDCVRMIMPCGELLKGSGDPDETEIV